MAIFIMDRRKDRHLLKTDFSASWRQWTRNVWGRCG